MTGGPGGRGGEAQGGGLYANTMSASVALSNVPFAGNNARGGDGSGAGAGGAGDGGADGGAGGDAQGGSVYVVGSTLQFTGSPVQSSYAAGGFGRQGGPGGPATEGRGGAGGAGGNGGNGQGGGLFADNGTVTITNSFIAKDTAFAGFGGSGGAGGAAAGMIGALATGMGGNGGNGGNGGAAQGGGLFTHNSTLALTNNVLSGHTAFGGPGDVGGSGGPASLLGGRGATAAPGETTREAGSLPRAA
jgi:hypothetical protein